MDHVEAVVRGRKIVVPMGLRRPVLEDFQDFENWLKLESDFALELKKWLESGETSARKVREEMINWSIRTEQTFKKVQDLKVEEKLLCVDHQIRISLSAAKPEPKLCVLLLQQLNSLHLTSFMLLKNPQVVDTIDQVTRYEGEISETCTSHMMAANIKQEEEIKKVASRIIRKFREIFKVPDEKSFSEVYKEKLAAFRERTCKMDLSDVFILTDESQEVGNDGQHLTIITI